MLRRITKYGWEALSPDADVATICPCRVSLAIGVARGSNQKAGWSD
jgi:hypothetical protein